MEAAAASRQWVTVAVAEIEQLQDTIRNQKGQLALALGVLMSLGFDLDDLLGVV